MVPVEEVREQVVLAPERSGLSVAAVCQAWGISRQTFYDWRRRYRAEGLEGLRERSRQPLNPAGLIDAEVEDEIVRMRKQHWRWGARRIRAELRRAGIPAPQVSTIHRVLRRNHLVTDQPEKRPKTVYIRFERDRPNDLWQIDATEVVLTDGATVAVIDIEDDYSRLLVANLAWAEATGEAAMLCLEKAVARYGPPRQVLSDNGLCFSGRRRGLEVAFERHLRSLGIQPITAAVRHPESLGKLERQHRTLKEFIEDWVLEHGPIASIEALQVVCDAYRHHYNNERPHQGIADQTPAERWAGLAPAVPEPARASVGAPQPRRRFPMFRSVRGDGRLDYPGSSVGLHDILITIGVEYVGTEILVVPDDEGLGLSLFYCGRLVRQLALEPGRRTYPSGARRGGPRRPRLIETDRP